MKYFIVGDVNSGTNLLAKELSDYYMHVPEDDMQISEDIHMSFDHMMMKIFYNLLVKNEVTGNNL